MGITADPAAASAEFDDSAWAVRDAKSAIDEVSDGDRSRGAFGREPGNAPEGQPERLGRQRRYAWFRLHIKLAPHHGPVALLIELPVSHNASVSVGSTGPGVDVFANGLQIHPEGPHGDAPQHYQQISRIYNLNLAPSETSLTLAVRTLYIPFGFSAYTSFFANRSLLLGHPADLERALELWSDNTLFERVPRLVVSIVLLVLAVFLFALYFAQRGHLEYLWLALHELVQAPIGFIELAGSSAHLDSLWYAALVSQLLVISAYLYFEFLISFLYLRKRWYIPALRYTAPILAGVGPTLLLVGHSRNIGVALFIVLGGSLLWVVAWFLFILITLTVATLRRNFEAGLLLFPLLLSLVGIIEPVLTEAMTDWTGHAYHSPLTLQAGAIPIHFASIADVTGIFAIVLIIFVRFLRIHRERERASSELAAARSVQELMIPQEKVATPGFEVDSVYNPAQEVGGDFFHVQADGDKGVLVVIGDVAGKGLKAAMSVSMLMGALRRIPEQSPAKILSALNRVLAGNDSFTTCQAVWFGGDGEVVLANAGHLPPYLNSQEVNLPGGLPLGVLPELSYEEVRLYLHPGDRLLLISDGVVEARQPSGELFGFDRVHNLSNQSAYYVAEAAKAFGQEDDITVLSVRRLEQSVAA
ncbi:MAG: PP2C family protein-serine/threonine phosphatase [Acidobacteriota bacterium]|nr:PP2C family protein-serine/threonine phosphatase [Acidobacteriota bacterium]